MSGPGPAHPPEVHEVDGILEHDNPLPRWWLITLYVTMLFSVGYWLHYHTTSGGPSLREAFDAEREAAEAARPRVAMTDAALTALAADPGALERGARVYAQNCVACHGDKGQGVIGPNLTDGYSIHGAAATALAKVVHEGVAAKGMPAWEPVLGPVRTREVVAFVLSLRGANLPGKAPQGVNGAGEPAPGGP